MLKIVTIALFALTFAEPLMTIQNHDPSDKHVAARQDKTPPPPAITNNAATNYYPQASDNKPKGWHKFVAWPEGITVWAILLTLGAIVWQAWETRKAAKAQIDGNRAWIFADLEKLGDGMLGHFTNENGKPATHLMLSLNFSNEGHSPAWVESIQAHMEILPRKQTPPKKVDFMSFPYRFTLKAGGKETMNPDFDCVGHMTQETDYLFIWVVIRYHDGHGIQGETSLGYAMNSSSMLFRQNNIPQRNYNK